MDGMLSQDEINALLSGMGSGGDDAESTGTATVTDTPDNNSAEDSFTLTESEKDAVGEISNISFFLRKLILQLQRLRLQHGMIYQGNMTDHVL